jgi:hypothetical protein
VYEKERFIYALAPSAALKTAKVELTATGAVKPEDGDTA